MTYLSVRNWERFQHYKDRQPIWIKFYVELLDDPELRDLPTPTRLLWDQLLLLAARYGNVIRNDPEEIAGLTRIPRQDVAKGINTLLKGRWLRETSSPRRASRTLAKSYENAIPEKEKETYKKPLAKHEETSRQPKWCNHCNTGFLTAQDLEHHMNQEHNVIALPMGGLA